MSTKVHFQAYFILLILQTKVYLSFLRSALWFTMQTLICCSRAHAGEEACPLHQWTHGLATSAQD